MAMIVLMSKQSLGMCQSAWRLPADFQRTMPGVINLQRAARAWQRPAAVRGYGVERCLQDGGICCE